MQLESEAHVPRQTRREGAPRAPTSRAERGARRLQLARLPAPPRGSRRRAASALLALVPPALLASGCSLAIDVDDYQFRPLDAGQERPAPLQPAPEAPPPALLPPSPGDPPPALARDAGAPAPSPPGTSPPDASPPPAASPPEPPRPVAIGQPGPVIELAGNPTGGGPRAADCPGGVVAGLYYRYFTDTGAFPSRLSFIAPICGAVEPTAPVLAFGGLFDARWLDITTGEPSALPELRDTEQEASVFCPGDEVVVGSGATFDDPVDGSVAFRTLTLSCATLGSDPERADVVHGPITVSAAPGLPPAPGAFAVEQTCPPGSAGTALELRSGAWLDTYGLRCSLIRWPFGPGHACASGTECQSGVCGPGAVCAP